MILIVVKPLISKLKKEYEILINPIFVTQSSDKLGVLKQDQFFTKTYLSPTQKFEDHSMVQIPLEFFSPNKKNLKVKYKITRLDHQSRRLYSELQQIGLLYLTSYSPKFGFNVEQIVKNEHLEMSVKILLLKKYNQKSCSKAIQKVIKQQVFDLIRNHYTDLSELLKDMCNKNLIKKVNQQVSLYGSYIKGVLITKAKKL